MNYTVDDDKIINQLKHSKGENMDIYSNSENN